MSPASTVTVGGVRLELDDLSGTRVTSVNWGAAPEAAMLQEALEAAERASTPDGDRSAADAKGGPRVLETAEQIAEQIERARSLWKELTAGRADAASARPEVDTLMDLFERLADDGREEALELAPPVERMLILTGRWKEVGRMLQRAAATARCTRDDAALGWVKHEQGTLRLAAHDREAAERKLRAARKMRRRVGDHSGWAASEANLRAAHVTGDRRARPRAWSDRLPATSLLLFLVVGVLAGGVVASLGDLVPDAATPDNRQSNNPGGGGNGGSGSDDDVRTDRGRRGGTGNARAHVAVLPGPGPVDRPKPDVREVPAPQPQVVQIQEQTQDVEQVVDVQPSPPQPTPAPEPDPDPPLVQVSLDIDTKDARVLVDGSERSCPPTCELVFDRGREVQLTAEPIGPVATPLDSFEWGGDCAPPRATGATCKLVVHEASRVTVRYRVALQGLLDVLKPGI